MDVDKLAMVASTVSSKMIEAMAHAEGFRFAECLTGGFDSDDPSSWDSITASQGSSTSATLLSR